jgi:hypothetical protein
MRSGARARHARGSAIAPASWAASQVAGRGQGPARQRLAMAAFGESCRRNGHHLASAYDPQRSSGRASSCKRLCHNHHSFTDLCSIISSARSRNDSGIASPSVLAVLRLMTISNFAGNCTGRSPGFAPRRMRSTANREPVHSGRRCNRPPAPGDRFRGKLDSRFASFPRSRGQSCPQSCGDEAGLWARGSWEAPGLEVKLLTPRSSSRDASRHLLILQAPGLRRSPLPPARLGLARSAFVQ